MERRSESDKDKRKRRHRFPSSRRAASLEDDGGTKPTLPIRSTASTESSFLKDIGVASLPSDISNSSEAETTGSNKYTKEHVHHLQQLELSKIQTCPPSRRESIMREHCTPSHRTAMRPLVLSEDEEYADRLQQEELVKPSLRTGEANDPPHPGVKGQEEATNDTPMEDELFNNLFPSAGQRSTQPRFMSLHDEQQDSVPQVHLDRGTTQQASSHPPTTTFERNSNVDPGAYPIRGPDAGDATSTRGYVSSPDSEEPLGQHGVSHVSAEATMPPVPIAAEVTVAHEDLEALIRDLQVRMDQMQRGVVEAVIVPVPSPTTQDEAEVVDVAPTDLPSTDDIVAEAQARYLRQRSALLDEQEAPFPTKEQIRDWEIGALTGHRITCLSIQGVAMVTVYFVPTWIWPHPDPEEQTSTEGIVSKLAFLWLFLVLQALCGFVGILWYRHNLALDHVPPLPQNLVVWRIVSRGTNEKALASTVQQCREQMKCIALFPYVIEVITDRETPYLEQTQDVIKLVPPRHYNTDKGTLYKARALHYASQNSPVPDNAWLVHLDEETHPTSSGIKGIAKMIAEEETSSTEPRFGQGAILYHRDWKAHPILTLADNIRTGDDFARFHLQMRLGLSIFGIHGSYVVCRNDVEKKLGGFDFGRVGSITEDAFWAPKAMDAGVRGRWVDGYMEEQSTQSVFDFMKQRRRWFLGLVLVSLFAPVRLRYRTFLLLSTFLWALAPMALLVTVLHFIHAGAQIDASVRILVYFAFCNSLTLYLMGLKANMLEHGVTNPLVKAFWYLMQFLLSPVFTILESASILYALVCPTCGFHVVTK